MFKFVSIRQAYYTTFFRSGTESPAKTLGPAFRSNAIASLQKQTLQNSITAAIGAKLPTSLLRTNLFKTALLFLLIICSSSILTPHSPDVSSTMLVQQKDGTWVLQIRAALTAFEYEVHNLCGKDSYATAEIFNELVIEHMLASLSISFNKQEPVTLANGAVKLGHETNVLFKVKGVPANFISVTIKNSSFENIYNSQSALIIFKDGFEKQQFILNGKNNYTANLTANKSNFVLKNN